jgi:predicted acylesterase/phospholipase RssA
MSDYSSTADNKDNVNKFNTETVLLLVAGGSLGAYECGVFKSLAR